MESPLWAGEIVKIYQVARWVRRINGALENKSVSVILGLCLGGIIALIALGLFAILGGYYMLNWVGWQVADKIAPNVVERYCLDGRWYGLKIEKEWTGEPSLIYLAPIDEREREHRVSLMLLWVPEVGAWSGKPSCYSGWSPCTSHEYARFTLKPGDSMAEHREIWLTMPREHEVLRRVLEVEQSPRARCAAELLLGEQPLPVGPRPRGLTTYL